MKNTVFWHVMPFGSCKNLRFGGMLVSIFRMAKIVGLETMVAVTSISSQLALVDSYCQRCSQLADSCHLDDGGDTFLRNVDCYKSHRRSIQMTLFFNFVMD
jgi:hypothetical protein